jgi:hypothetical protein
VYAVELRFAIRDVACAPSIDVVVEGLRRSRPELRGNVEHLRVRRHEGTFHAVLFVTAASPQEANVVGGVIGFAAAATIPAIRFTGVWPWPDPGEPGLDADPEQDS